jgi:hypothetical protein
MRVSKRARIQPGVTATAVKTVLRADDPAAIAVLRPLLVEAGLTRIAIETLPLGDEARVVLDPGPLERLEAHVEIAAIAGALARATKELGIDHARHPIEITRGRGADHVRIDLPSAAILSGALRPWSPLAPERYAVEILDDDRGAGITLERAFHAAGFKRAKRRHLGKIGVGFAIRCGKKIPESMQEQARRLVDAELVRLGARDFGLAVVSDDGDAVTIEFPARAFHDGSLAETLANPARYALKVIGASAEVCAPLIADFKTWGFRSVRCKVDPDDDPPGIRFGGAPLELVTRMQETVKRFFGIDLPPEKAWPMTDSDIFLRLPSSLPAVGTAAVPAPAPQAKRRSSKPVARGPFIELTAGAVSFAGVTLPRRTSSHAAVRHASIFKSFCVDQRVAETLVFLAQGLRERVPLALEGPTAASKTWPIQYFLALLGWPAFRLNMHAATSSSDILGRFVPDSKRPGIFPWSYGPLPRAMLEGAALILDECNLAPTDTLELLNPCLENAPRLVLSEYDHRVIGDGDLHPDFRVLATWNDQKYVGRQELSPAFLDRFTIRVVQPPEERDFLALGRYLVHGIQPDVVIGRDVYRGARGPAPLPGLGAVPDIDGFLVAFARFQASLANAGAAELHAAAPGRPLLATRRSFVRVLERMHRILDGGPSKSIDRRQAAQAAWAAIGFFLIGGLDGAAQPMAEDLAAACGIQPDGWSLPS